MLKNDYFLALLALSCLCVLILIGFYRYTGSFLPLLEGATDREIVGIWVIASIIIGVPTGTFLWWVAALLNRRRP